MQGRGICITAGGPVQLASVWSTLSTLRHHLNSSLPVELFFNGSAEMDEDSQRAFEVGCRISGCL